MISKTILAEVRGFTPLVDVLVDKLGVMDAVVFGRVWRYCQMETGKCTASMKTIAAQLALSQSTVRRHLQRLCSQGYLKDETPDRRNAPHIYSDTGKVQLIALIEAGLSERPTEVCQKDRPVCQKEQPRSVRKTNEDSSLRDNEKTEKEEKETDFLSQIPKPNRERIRDVLIDVLAEGLIPESDFLIRPFETGVDALVLEFRQLEGKSRLDDDLTSKIIAAIRSAYEDEENWQFARVDTPTRPLIACIVAEGRERLKRAASHIEWQEASDRTQKALAEREPAPERDPWWDQVLADLSLVMAKAMFDTYVKDTTLLAREAGLIIVGVKTQYALDWIQHRLAPTIKRALLPYGIERVRFEVVGISSGDVRPLMGKEE